MAKENKTNAEKAPLIPEKFQDLVAIGAIFLIVFIFLGEAIFGGGFNVSDNISSHSFVNYLEEADEAGEFPQWVPYIFGGMPSYSALLTTGNRSWDVFRTIPFGITEIIGNAFDSDVARMSCFYFLLGLGIYLLMRHKKHDRLIAFTMAVAAILSTYVITWVMIGHNTKPVVFAMFPFVFLFMEKLKEKFSLITLVLLVAAIHLMFEAGHLQMIFYGALSFFIYFVVELIMSLKSKSHMPVIKSGAMLVLASAIAFLMSSDRYLSSLEYQKYSTRGAAPIEQIAKTSGGDISAHDKEVNQEKIDSANYAYSTAWSYSPQEVITFINPGYFGFGTPLYTPEGRGSNTESFLLPTYWGQKNSEDSPPYMGIGVFALALLGLILYRKDSFVMALGVISIFSLFLSFGNNLSFLYDLFYYNVPLFNKFRAPSMALAMMHFAVPVLAGYGLSGILQWRKTAGPKEYKLINAGLILSVGYLVFAFIFSAVFKGQYMSAVSSSPKIAYYSQQLATLPDIIWGNMMTDWYIVALIAIFINVLIYLFVKKKIKQTVFLIGIALLVIIDLWRVDVRRMEVSDEKMDESVFAQYKPVYEGLQAVKDTSVFRMVDLVGTQNVNAYFLIESVNGYHAAKLRVYQDMLDVANLGQFQGNTSVLFNPYIWDIMNVKYKIQQNKSGQPGIFRLKAQDRAFFVNKVEVKKPMEILLTMRELGNRYVDDANFYQSYDPKELMYVEKELPAPIEAPTAGAYAKLLEHKNEYIKIEANATGNNLLFVGEIYYPAGWKAYIDGKETEIIKTNYAFRSVIVPAGKHEIEFKFDSPAFETGKTFSLAMNVLTLLGAGFGIFLFVRNRKKNA